MDKLTKEFQRNVQKVNEEWALNQEKVGEKNELFKKFDNIAERDPKLL